MVCAIGGIIVREPLQLRDVALLLAFCWQLRANLAETGSIIDENML